MRWSPVVIDLRGSKGSEEALELSGIVGTE
jgi:hypothetical protein